MTEQPAQVESNDPNNTTQPPAQVEVEGDAVVNNAPDGGGVDKNETAPEGDDK